MLQNRYSEALKAYEEALKIFKDLGEPNSVATVLHQTGMVFEEAGQFKAAEQAYRRALAIEVQQNETAGEASTLGQLGLLYDKMGRVEEAVIFFRQVKDKHIKLKDLFNEGHDHHNIAACLIKLKRYDEARGEINRAIECKEPYGHAATLWNVWNLLSTLEQAEGNKEAAAKARGKAIELYLDYRKDGGENHERGGPLCTQFWQAMQENKTEEMEKLLAELENDSETHPLLKILIAKLKAIIGGSREPELAADPELHYTDAAEILFLLERLPK
jgi:tetratricopeptide (TPR) repeat protein